MLWKVSRSLFLFELVLELLDFAVQLLVFSDEFLEPTALFIRHANLKYKYGSRHFWCRGYYVDTVGRNEKVISEYIKNQTEEDYMADQMTLKEYIDPFTGSKNK